MTKKIGDVILDVKNISLRFGGVKALTDISFNVREHEIRAIIGPNGAGKSSMLNCINGVYQPQQGTITFRGKTFKHMNSRQVAEMGVARTFQNLALFKGMSVIDNIMTGRNLKIKSNILMQALRIGPAEREEIRTANSSSTSSTSWRSRPTARRPWASCPTACKSAWTWAARWPWSRRCCCWTSPWPA
jgi:branched-chain amino acid transport system ATP-binding protein